MAGSIHGSAPLYFGELASAVLRKMLWRVWINGQPIIKAQSDL